MIRRKHVFITRNLPAGSYFLQALTARGFVVEGGSLIAFLPVEFVVAENVDWIFFYSRQAVRFFFAGLSPDRWDKLPLIAAMGAGTASALRELAKEVDFTGSGSPDGVATAFAEVAAGQSVLFPRARNSRQSIQRKLGGLIRPVDLIVYDNQPQPRVVDPAFQYLVFTSPMNVTSFLQSNVLSADQIVIAIGNSTARYLHKAGVGRVVVAPEASERGLCQAILDWENEEYGS